MMDSNEKIKLIRIGFLGAAVVTLIFIIGIILIYIL